MDLPVLKFSYDFFLNFYKSHFQNEPETQRLRETTASFAETMRLENWNKKKLYLIFMFFHFFPEIKESLLNEPNQHKKWTRFLKNGIAELAEKHLNFILNAEEFVSECLNIFFIT